jgi:hypothetical protein
MACRNRQAILTLVRTMDTGVKARHTWYKPSSPNALGLGGAQMADDPALDVRHHDLLVKVIEEIVKVSVVQLQGLVL